MNTRIGFRTVALATASALGATLAPVQAQTNWFAPTSFWRTKVTEAGTVGGDATKLYNQWAYYLDGTSKIGSNWQTTLGLNNPVNTVPDTQPTITVTSTSGGADYYMDPIWAAVPFPASTYINPVDKHVVIWQPGKNRMWEFWGATITSTSPLTVKASWGAFMNNVTNSDGIFPSPYGATATGLPLVGGMITLAEAAAIKANPTSSANLIPHVLCINLPQVANYFVGPATRMDSGAGTGIHGGPNAIPEGRRFRLPPNVTVPSGPPLLRAVVIAARDYGMVVRDNTGNGNMIAFLGEVPKPGDTFTSADWSAIMSPKAGWNVFDGFPWSQVLALSEIKGWGLVDGARYEFALSTAPASCLNVYGSGGQNGSNVCVWPYYGGNVQLWTAQKQSDNSFELYPSHATGTRLQVSGGGGTGTNVDIWADMNTPQQRWTVGLASDGSYIFTPKHGSTLALNFTGTAQNSNVNVIAHWGQSSVRWFPIRR